MRALATKIDWIEFKHSHKAKYSIKQLEKMFEEKITGKDAHTELAENNWAVVIANHYEDDVISGNMSLEDLDDAFNKLMPLDAETNRQFKAWEEFWCYGLDNFINDYMSGGNDTINAILRYGSIDYDIGFENDLMTCKGLSSSDVVQGEKRGFAEFMMERLIDSFDLSEKGNEKLWKSLMHEVSIQKYNGKGLFGNNYEYKPTHPYIIQLLEIFSLEEIYVLLGDNIPVIKNCNPEDNWVDNPIDFILKQFRKYKLSPNGIKKLNLLGGDDIGIQKRIVINTIVNELDARVK